ncbi:MAG: hypothetical protein INR72_20100 [Williamsia herbipolensis]|nr:hypothetical protein [Williamsia herbipolensis]
MSGAFTVVLSGAFSDDLVGSTVGMEVPSESDESELDVSVGDPEVSAVSSSVEPADESSLDLSPSSAVRTTLESTTGRVTDRASCPPCRRRPAPSAATTVVRAARAAADLERARLATRAALRDRAVSSVLAVFLVLTGFFTDLPW